MSARRKAPAREIVRNCRHLLAVDIEGSGGSALPDATCWRCCDKALVKAEAEGMERAAQIVGRHTAGNYWHAVDGAYVGVILAEAIRAEGRT